MNFLDTFVILDTCVLLKQRVSDVKDLAKKQMAKLGVRVMRSGAFLNDVYNAEPDAATHAVLQAAKDLKKPPYTVPELLHTLRKQGAKTLVARMEWWPRMC